MTFRQQQGDLVCLVPDGNTEAALKGLFGRYKSLGVRQIDFRLYVHPHRDPGCLTNGPDFLRPFACEYSHALIVLDREGSGADRLSAQEMEADLEQRLSQSGWGARASVIMIDPELEIWVWSDSPHVDIALGWRDRVPGLRAWLVDSGLAVAGEMKPCRPKEALEKALWVARKPRSSSIYAQLAQNVSIDRCLDRAFVKVKTALRKWFV